MSELIAQVEAVISGRQLLRKGQGVLLAVSGGLDSMVLLHVVSLLARQWRWKLTVAHFNHRLRGRASDADERLVHRAAEELDIAFVGEAGDVKRAAAESGVSLEMAARELRHGFLARAARQRRIGTVALAHHADDQVELFLLRLLRGAGTDGLAGMRWSSPSPADARVKLIRPLLGCAKSELTAFARDHKIRFREDASNARLDHQRNRVRNELLPWLEKEYQPGVRGSILRAIEILREEGDVLRAQALEWLQAGERKPFAKLSVAIQRRCLQAWLVGHKITPDFELIEQLRSQPGRKMSVGRGQFVARQADGLVLSGAVDEAAGFSGECLEVDLQAPFGEVLFAGITVRWHRVGFAGRAQSTAKCGRAVEAFDAAKIGDRIKLRHWQPGDRFQPIGMKREIKLQDWFTNLKVRREQRHRLVVAEAGDGRLFWVEGLRIAEGFKLDKTTRRRLQWEWRRDAPAEIATGPQP